MLISERKYFYKVILSLLIIIVLFYCVFNIFFYEPKIAFPLIRNKYVFPKDEEERKTNHMELEFFIENPQLLKNETVKNWTESTQQMLKRLYSNVTLTENYIKQYHEWAVEKERNALLGEMQGFFSNQNKTIDKLVIEKGGQPIRNVIFTTWRSGSTFLGEVLLSHPGTFYNFEPLLEYGIMKIRSGYKADNAISFMQNLLNCSYEKIDERMSEFSIDFAQTYNKRLYKYCSSSPKACHSPDFLSRMCQLYPIQLMKTVRSPLRFAEQLLIKNLNVKIIYLVRDPRGTIHSRLYTDFCSVHPDCYDTSILCSDLQEDFEEAQKLREKYPNNFIAVRYEDVSLNPHSAVNELFPFLGLTPTVEVDLFVKSHTEKERMIDGPYTTFRNSKDTPFKWISYYATRFEELESIEQKCKIPLESWGYELASNLSNLLNQKYKTLREPPWPLITIPKEIVNKFNTSNLSHDFNDNSTNEEDPSLFSSLKISDFLKSLAISLHLTK